MFRASIHASHIFNCLIKSVRVIFKSKSFYFKVVASIVNVANFLL